MSVETIRFDRQRALVQVSGDLDLTTTAPLWAVLRGHLAAGRRFVRLDLSGVTFLDASALNGIARAHQDLLARRGTLVITDAGPFVARVLRLAGLHDLLFLGRAPSGDDLDLPSDVRE
jgi:anti-anti-sigma factor